MLSALEGPIKKQEAFITACIKEVGSINYLQTKVCIGYLPKSQKESVSAKMSEMNLTLCHALYRMGLETYKYRHKPKKDYDKMAAMPDTLYYTDEWETEEIYERLTRMYHRITGLFIANREIIQRSPEKDTFGNILKQLYKIKEYVGQYS